VACWHDTAPRAVRLTRAARLPDQREPLVTEECHVVGIREGEPQSPAVLYFPGIPAPLRYKQTGNATS